MDLERATQFLLEQQAAHAAWLEAHRHAIAEHDRRIAEHDQRMAEHDRRLDKHEQLLGDVAGMLRLLVQAQAETREQIKAVGERLDVVVHVLDDMIRRPSQA